MLQLKNIIKDYYAGEQKVEALKGISVSFRKNEFVSVLGPSGCGKTTLLNIIGGLDRYTQGDIVINGVSTKLYADSDWDAYRNHSIGFVFQSYNLIPHQTIIENVELALTLSGVSKKERRERAKAALEKVGLNDQLNKLPRQLSGGQMQRVAIARAIVNDPDIILADEPTGALDTETSVQVMDILKQLSEEKLVIMVTHNPDLAYKYSTRIIRLKDGILKEDSNPFEYTFASKQEQKNDRKNSVKKLKKPSMSLLTALSLSLKNLGTKKARTILTSFAGSIGIIGIALILSLSAGFNDYIANVQKNTLSNYPVTIGSNAFSMSGYITSFMGSTKEPDLEKYPENDQITSNKMIGNMLESVSLSYGSNDLASFKSYLEAHPELIDSEKISAVNYSYDVGHRLFTANTENGKKNYREVNYIDKIEHYIDDETTMKFFEQYYLWFKNTMETSGTWGEMTGSLDLVKAQYDLLEGKWADEIIPEKDGYYPLTVVVDKYNRLPDYALYMMGLMTDEEVRYMFSEMAYKVADKVSGETTSDKKLEEKFPELYKNGGLRKQFDFNEFLNKEYTLLLESDLFKVTNTKTVGEKTYNIYSKYDREDAEYKSFLNKTFNGETTAASPITLKITGIVRLKENSSEGSLSQNVFYTPQLTSHMIELSENSKIVKEQQNNIDNATQESDGYKYIVDVLSGKEYISDNPVLQDTYSAIGMVDESKPTSISLYPSSFENKDYVINIINQYNAQQTSETTKIQYTDYLGMMMSSITVIINAISYVLIAFVSISLVVSSIMIGVITYISVLERTKEIGILRSLGASKSDVGRVFNAETIIIGFISGIMGIVLTVILDVPISIIINSLAGIPNIASLPTLGAVILVAISVVLTLIAGLIPSRFAAKRDPVIALRSD